MTKEEERELRAQLARLQQEHRDLDAAIAALQDFARRRRDPGAAPQETQVAIARPHHLHRGSAHPRYHRLAGGSAAPCAAALDEAIGHPGQRLRLRPCFGSTDARTHAFKFGCTAVYPGGRDARRSNAGAGRRARNRESGGRCLRLGAPAAFAAALQPPGLAGRWGCASRPLNRRNIAERGSARHKSAIAAHHRPARPATD